MTVASAGPYASLHLAPDRYHASTPPLSFFTGRMLFLLPNEQCQSTEGKCAKNCTINLFFKTAISILVILNHDSYRVLFDRIASVYFI